MAVFGRRSSGRHKHFLHFDPVKRDYLKENTRRANEKTKDARFTHKNDERDIVRHKSLEILRLGVVFHEFGDKDTWRRAQTALEAKHAFHCDYILVGLFSDHNHDYFVWHVHFNQ